MTAMKAMKATRVSKIAKGKLAKAVVFRGTKEKTQSGLKKNDLMKTKTGRIVSKKSHAAGKKAYARIKGWTTAVQKARKALGIKGFQAVKKGSPLYKKAKAIYIADQMGWQFDAETNSFCNTLSPIAAPAVPYEYLEATLGLELYGLTSDQLYTMAQLRWEAQQQHSWEAQQQQVPAQHQQHQHLWEEQRQQQQRWAEQPQQQQQTWAEQQPSASKDTSPARCRRPRLQTAGEEKTGELRAL